MGKINHTFQKIRHYHSTLGIFGVAAFIFAKIVRSHPVFKIRISGIKHPVYLRIGTTDVTVLKQVLIEKHYDISSAMVPQTILDAGANIGFSAIFFANKYPGATIVALEPESSNFQLLQKNVAPYPQIKPIQAALWNKNAQISLIDPDFGHHGFQTIEGNAGNLSQTGTVQALTVEDVMFKIGLKTVDLLKIDIEGAEKEVFESSEKWMDKVQVVMVELHENLKPGCTEAFEKATKALPHEFLNGETIMRLRTIKPS